MTYPIIMFHDLDGCLEDHHNHLEENNLILENIPRGRYSTTSLVSAVLLTSGLTLVASACFSQPRGAKQHVVPVPARPTQSLDHAEVTSRNTQEVERYIERCVISGTFPAEDIMALYPARLVLGTLEPRLCSFNETEQYIPSAKLFGFTQVLDKHRCYDQLQKMVHMANLFYPSLTSITGSELVEGNIILRLERIMQSSKTFDLQNPLSRRLGKDVPFSEFDRFLEKAKTYPVPWFRYLDEMPKEDHPLWAEFFAKYVLFVPSDKVMPPEAFFQLMRRRMQRFKMRVISMNQVEQLIDGMENAVLKKNPQQPVSIFDSDETLSDLLDSSVSVDSATIYESDSVCK